MFVFSTYSIRGRRLHTRNHKIEIPLQNVIESPYRIRVDQNLGQTIRKGTNGVSAQWGRCESHVFWHRDFWGAPVNLLLSTPTGLGAEDCTPEITKVKFRWKIPLEIHRNFL